jgi:hypothetical protein
MSSSHKPLFFREFSTLAEERQGYSSVAWRGKSSEGSGFRSATVDSAITVPSEEVQEIH